MNRVAPDGAADQAILTSALVSADHTTSPEPAAGDSGPPSPGGQATSNAGALDVPVVEPGPDGFVVLRRPAADASPWTDIEICPRR